MSGVIQELKVLYKTGGALIRFIFINAAVFILTSLIYLFSGRPALFFLDYWLSLPSDPVSLMHRPWTLITYMFYHRQIFHFLFNALNLYWFGKIFLMYFNDRKLIVLYFLGGIAGGIFYVLVYNLFPTVFGLGILMGASASIIAIMFASAFYAPNFKVMLVFFGEVKLIYLAIFSLLLFIVLLSSDNAGGNLAHLGGAFVGYLFAKQYQRGRDFTSGIGDFFESFFSLFRRRKLKVTHKRSVNDLEYNRKKNLNQQEVDRILDKISKGGYGSLTKDEKDTLFRMSQNS
jgi:membrane associated rhomboid family serine protease